MGGIILPSSAASHGDRAVGSSANATPPSDLYEDVTSEFTRRCVLMEIYGDTDTGRSTLALTAPGPICYVHFYEKVDGLLQDVVQRGVRVRQCKIGDILRGDSKQVIELAEIAAARMEQAISGAYSWARTIIVDTHTEAWQVVQLAKLGGLTPETKDEDQVRKGQLVYAELNARWASLMKEFRKHADEDNRTNLIFIGQTSAEYKKVAGSNRAENTGRTVSAGQKQMSYFMDVRLRTYFKNGVYSAVAEKAWFNDSARGAEFTSEAMDLDFASVMSRITRTSEKEWQ